MRNLKLKHNTKFNFWVVSEHYQTKNKTDFQKFFSTEKEAKEYMKVENLKEVKNGKLFS